MERNEIFLIKYFEHDQEILIITFNLLSQKLKSILYLAIGGLFSLDSQNGTVNYETDEEIIFKHAIYISNQLKNTLHNTLPYYPTLLHKIVHVPENDRLNTIKKICKEIHGNMIAIIDPRLGSFKLYSRSLSENLDLIHFDIEQNSEPKTEAMLKMALQLGMINSTFNYILTSLDAETMNLDDFKYNRANITTFRLVKSESEFHRKITLNLTDYLFHNWKDNEKSNILLKRVLIISDDPKEDDNGVTRGHVRMVQDLRLSPHLKMTE
ncbi:glutamate receptor kainate 2-like isoform X1 [Brachionus plicatilis]|uniref:Glutamate receptor kainate 2-like isoform X1 n=1 Tax=Brachionus plicatilis TaxID=10195 RepID=A0A3M7RSG5_BRAPC|nr:glutamate receptor kainate 2-like isoform X1 [Brachionus plicatilis]